MKTSVKIIIFIIVIAVVSIIGLYFLNNKNENTSLCYKDSDGFYIKLNYNHTDIEEMYMLQNGEENTYVEASKLVRETYKHGFEGINGKINTEEWEPISEKEFNKIKNKVK